MNAKESTTEYLEHNYKNIFDVLEQHGLVGESLVMLESYHQHKLSEITEEEIREAWYFFSNVTTEGELMTEENFKKAISNLLKGER